MSFYGDLRSARLAYFLHSSPMGRDLLAFAISNAAEGKFETLKQFFQSLMHLSSVDGNMAVTITVLTRARYSLGLNRASRLIQNLGKFQSSSGFSKAISGAGLEGEISYFWILWGLMQLLQHERDGAELQVELEGGDLAVFPPVDKGDLKAESDLYPLWLREPRIVTARVRLAVAIAERFSFNPMNPPAVVETWGNFWTPTQRELYKVAAGGVKPETREES